MFFGCSTSKIGLVFRLGATVICDERFQSVFCPVSYGGTGGSGYELGAVLTCHTPSLAMNFHRDKIASNFISKEFTAPW